MVQEQQNVKIYEFKIGRCKICSRAREEKIQMRWLEVRLRPALLGTATQLIGRKMSEGWLYKAFG